MKSRKIKDLYREIKKAFKENKWAYQVMVKSDSLEITFYRSNRLIKNTLREHEEELIKKDMFEVIPFIQASILNPGVSE